MGDVINLNRARKARARRTARIEADANRVSFGRTKAQKDAEAQSRERARTLLDGAKREDRPVDPGE